jgi:hypothetical protein
MSNIPSSNL